MWESLDFTNLNVLSIFLRLSLSVLLGGIIGLERGIKGRPAGMRTYMLVCLGSTLVMLTNQYLTEIYGADPARLGAQVISGIGFLGAGTIIITRDRQVRGLTTAAGLWASACMGLAIGVGFYAGALVGMVFILVVTTLMHRLDSKLLHRSRSMDLYVEVETPSDIHHLLGRIRATGTKVTYLEVVRPKYGDQNRTALLLALFMPARKIHYEVLTDFREFECVTYIEEV